MNTLLGKTTLFTLTLTLALAIPLARAQGNMSSASASSDKVIATVNGDNLTMGDLENKEVDHLLQPRYQYYEAERKALDDLIDQHLLEMQASREHITVDQLLKREVDSKVVDPTDDQLRVYYEGLESNQPYDEIRGKILDHIRDSRKSKLRAAYLKTLRSDAKIFISLAPPAAPVDLQNAEIHGNPDAPVMLVEFADYQCPYCQKISADVLRLEKEFGPKLAVAFKDFPLPMHANAQKAAEAARCAGDQGKFWEFHDLLFSDKKLELADLKTQARNLKLDGTKFDVCLDSGEQTAIVQKDLAEGRKLGLTGTPSFFVNGHFFSGALDYATLRDLVEQQLSSSLSSARGVALKESSLR